MAYNSKIDLVYNHYLTAYAPKSTTSKYDSHKKSELKGVYNSMLKLNKDSPLYLLDSSKEARRFVVGLKEDARELRNLISELGGTEDAEMFSRKSAYSTDEDMVSASFIGTPEQGRNANPFEIEVLKLASNQENLGAALKSDGKPSLPPDTYSFDISINDLSYEFQFNIREEDTNRDIQDRLSRLITKADIGVHADVLETGNGESALRLISADDGNKKDRDLIFQVSDDRSSKASGSVGYFGIDYVSKEPSDAEFLLNGEPRTASENHFTVDGQYEVTLNGVAREEGHSARVGVKTDLDSITENVGNLFEGYNRFVDSASEYRQSHPASTKLMGELDRMVSYYSDRFEPLGISSGEDGRISIDERRFKSALAADNGFEKLNDIKSFASSVLNKANRISLNPMEYVDKKVVAYKNPGHNFTAPYVNSNYSGMLFSSYC